MRTSNDSLDQRAATQVKVRAVLFLLLGVGAMVGAVVLVRAYLAQLQQEAAVAAPRVRQVVVAAVDIPIATRLDPEHLKLVSWPADQVPETSLTDLKDALQKTVRQDLIKGEPILTGRLADENLGQGLAALLADGMRAMAVEVDAVVGVAGFVQPGDHVDVITTMQPDEQTRRALKDESGRMSKIVLQNVRVLAVGEHLTTAEGGRPVNVKVVTLGVTPKESETLALGSQYGRLQLSLRSRIDTSTASTEGTTPTKLLAAGVTPQPEKPAEPEKPRVVFRHAKPEPRAEAAKPEAPVVEILRGTGVEQRKLRSGE